MREKLEQLVEALCNAKLYHWARRVEAILNSQPSFVPGMVIGPGHGRRFTHTLEKFYRYDTHDSSEIWYTKDANGLHFYPDDLRDRVLYDPRMATAEDFQKSTKLLGELSKQVEAAKPAQWKPGQRLVYESGQIIKLESVDGSGQWTYRWWTGDAWSIENHWAGGWDNAVPWPRVGDWVSMVGLPHQVTPRDIENGCVYNPGSGNNIPLRDLEPASPPEQPFRPASCPGCGSDVQNIPKFYPGTGTICVDSFHKQIEAQPEPPAFQAGPTTSVQREESIKAREEDLTTGP